MQTAKRVERRRQHQSFGLEGLVDLAAIATLIFGIIVALGLLLTAQVAGFVSSIFALAGGFLNWLLLRCLAEHLRIQKKIAGLEYSGKITGPYETTFWCCSNCGQVLHSDTICESCGAPIVADDK